MSLRHKTVIIIGMTIVCLIVIPYFMLRGILRDSVATLEDTSTKQDVRRALSALDSDIQDMGTLTYDWAAWDDTYQFIVDHNKEYIESNLPDESFWGLKLDIMLFIDATDKVVFSRTCNESREQAFDIPEAALKEIFANEEILRHEDPAGYKSGIIILAEGPLAFSSRPITTTKQEGPVHGTLIFGRYLRDKEISILEERTHLSLRICKLNDPENAAAVPLISGDSIVVRPLSQQEIAGYTLVSDFYGHPAFLLRVEVPREIYQQGRANVAQFILYFLPVGLVFGAATLLLIEKLVVSRLLRLSKNVSAIGTRGDLSARLQVVGKDEVANVAGEINHMLEALEKSEVVEKTNKTLATANRRAEEVAAYLRKEREFSARIIDTAKAILVILDTDGKIVLSNAFASELTGYAKEELIGRNWLETLLPENEKARVSEAFHALIANGLTGTYENSIRSKNGGERLIMWSTSVLRNEDGTIAGTLSVGNDITERKQAETALRESQEELKRDEDELMAAKEKAEAASLELVKKVNELEAFNRLAVGREATMIELKRQINKLCEEQGRPAPYDLALLGDGNDGK